MALGRAFSVLKLVAARALALFYDVDVALAEALDAPLLSRDRRLAAAPGHGARVELA